MHAQTHQAWQRHRDWLGAHLSLVKLLHHLNSTTEGK